MISYRKQLWTMVLGLALVGTAWTAEADRYLPKETEQVVVVNVKQMLGSPLIKKLALAQIEEKLKDSKDLKALQEATGLDLLKDVHTIVVANTGTTGDNVTVVIRGRFDVDKLAKVAEAVAKEKGEIKIGKIGDRNLYEASKDGKTFFLTFIDGTTAVGSTTKANVVAAVDGKAGKINKDLAAAVGGIDGKQSIWVAALVPEEARAALGQVDQGPKEALKKVKAASGGLNITTDVAATFSLSTGDAKAAKELGDFANQAKGLIAFAAAGNEMIKPFADELLKTLKIQTTQGGDISLSFKLSEEIIKKGLELIPKQ
jgi:hypothetical protein